MAFKIFIAWSGPRSKQLADALREWLEIVIQNTEPWMSARDGEGAWDPQINTELDNAGYGIVCVTKENWNSPWLNYELGRLSNDNGARVQPYLLDLEADTLRGPLAQLTAVRADRYGTESLVRKIAARAFPGEAHERHRVLISQLAAERWLELEATIGEIRALPRYRRVSEKELKASEERSILTKAYNHSLDAEVGFYQRDTNTFEVRDVYLMDTVLANVKKGREYKYILAPHPWTRYEGWVESILQQLRQFHTRFHEICEVSHASRVTFTLICAPTPLLHSVDIHHYDAGLNPSVGYCCEEGYARGLPHNLIVEAVDPAYLATLWRFLEAIGKEYGREVSLIDLKDRMLEIGYLFSGVHHLEHVGV